MSGGKARRQPESLAPGFADLWRDYLPPQSTQVSRVPTAPPEPLDLHGDSRAEALRRLRDFVLSGVAAGHHQLEVVHGRGAHTADGFAVLRPAVRSYLKNELHAWVRGIKPQVGSADGATTIYLKRHTAGDRQHRTGR